MKVIKTHTGSGHVFDCADVAIGHQLRFPLVLLYPLEKALYLLIAWRSKAFNVEKPLFSNAIIFI